ncbi:MAG: hypothetical protein QOJ76_2208 [Acidobacteriota bacterium]|nr:hypothetical protein [Acidobacteriota bacterium]
MRKPAGLVLLALALCVCARTARAFQTGDGRTPTNTTGDSNRGTRGKPTRTNVTRTNMRSAPPAPPPPPVARLGVRTSPVGSLVEFDGTALGSTDESGFLRLPPATVGQHTLVVRRSGYYEYRRVVTLAGGLNDTIEVTLPPQPGHLSVTPQPFGATVTVEGHGTFSNSVSELELVNGRYHVSISRLGYAPVEQDVTIAPGNSSNVVLTLIALPTSELIAGAESAFSAGQYEQAVTLGEMAYPQAPSNPRLNFVLGMSYVRRNDPQSSMRYLRQAVLLGENITFNVKHLHRLKKGEGLCQGQLVLRSNTLEFRSGENPAEKTSSSRSAKIFGMRPDGDKGWRLSMTVMLPDVKKQKEKGFEYSFHPTQAYLRNKDPRKSSSPTLVACSDCRTTVEFIYQLIQQTIR